MTPRDTALVQSVTDEDDDTITYDYDAGGRLTSARNTGGVDYRRRVQPDVPHGRVDDHQLHCQCANQVTAAGSTTYSYDDAGNLTGDSSGRQLDYNAAGQLTGMKASSSASMVDVEYAGDGNFERVAYGSTDFADSLLGTSAREGGGAPDPSYVRDPNGTLTVVREGSDRRYVIADMLGSVIALTDESGAVTQEYTYTPYGQTTETAHAGAVSNPWRSTGAPTTTRRRPCTRWASATCNHRSASSPNPTPRCPKPACTAPTPTPTPTATPPTTPTRRGPSRSNVGWRSLRTRRRSSDGCGLVDLQSRCIYSLGVLVECARWAWSRHSL